MSLLAFVFSDARNVLPPQHRHQQDVVPGADAQAEAHPHQVMLIKCMEKCLENTNACTPVPHAFYVHWEKCCFLVKILQFLDKSWREISHNNKPLHGCYNSAKKEKHK